MKSAAGVDMSEDLGQENFGIDDENIQEEAKSNNWVNNTSHFL